MGGTALYANGGDFGHQTAKFSLACSSPERLRGASTSRNAQIDTRTQKHGQQFFALGLGRNQRSKTFKKTA